MSTTRGNAFDIVTMLAWGIVCLASVATVPSEVRAQETRAEEYKTWAARRAIVNTRDRSVIQMDLGVRGIRLDVTQSDIDTTQRAKLTDFIVDVEVWNERPSRTAPNPDWTKALRDVQNRVGRIEKLREMYRIEVEGPVLKQALIKHKAQEIYRPVAPPYDTLATARSGKTVRLVDLATRFHIVFEDSTARNDFLNAASSLPVVEDAVPPASLSSWSY